MHGRFVICWFILVLGLFNCCYMYAASTLCRSRCAVGVLTLYYLLFTTYSLLLSVEADVLWVYTISGLHGLVDPVPVSFFSTTYSLLLTLYYLLFTTYSLLLTLYYSLQYYLLFTTGLVGPVPVSFFSAARDTSPNSYVSFPVHITAHTHDTCILSMLPHILSILPHMYRT